jgi:flagellar basal body-associated protein FliL
MSRSALTVGSAFAALAATSIVCAPSADAQTSEASPFVAMDEISVPIVDASRIDGVLRISITLQARDANDAAKLAKRMPELRATSLSAAMEFARLHASPFTPVDARKLAAMLTPALQRVDDSITKILIVRLFALEG